MEKVKKSRKKWHNIKITAETYQEITRLRAWLELSQGVRYSVDKTICEMAKRFMDMVTIPWSAVESPKVGGSPKSEKK
ncbi:MAG: hypothetical protein QW687_01605 [Candidatus Hadarchaeales archaeon]